ncbi:MAG TPA: transglutaminase-like domain-containing protein, partial [Gammaproteobacteria bacterium]|nr:transglutaminase-like domain-containing protein [Gammaproteobacteria bacterium]
GNRVMVFQIDGIPPYGTQVITVTAKVRRYSRWQPVDGWHPLRQLQAGEYMALNAPVIQDAAHALSRQSAIATASEVLGYLGTHIRAVDYIREDRGAAYALLEGRGDCTEYMYAFSALMRANEIPTLNFGGFLSDGSEVLHSARYHNWAAYEGENGWVVVDPEQSIADASGNEYLVFRVFNPSAPHSLSNTHRFVSMDENLKVTFN